MAPIKELFLFDPITGIKQSVTYGLISGMTGFAPDTLPTYKLRGCKLGNVGKYIVDASTSKEFLWEKMRSEVIPKEIWKAVVGYPGYQISDWGRVRKIMRNGTAKLLIPGMTYTGTKKLCINMSRDKRKSKQYIHRVVADNFVFNLTGGDCVHFINWNQFDCRAVNLEWLTRSQLSKKTKSRATSIPVLKICQESGDVLDEYRSISEAARANNILISSVWECVRGGQFVSGGFRWAMDDEEYAAKKDKPILCRI